ncbi:MAG: peptidoglycan DD-metalloendopeptidase family protein [Synergistaceae bacterium]|nr:peptidoglycan DD-metalloendopeptidase family protein [Synergistaceae bacterium]
MKKKIQQYNAIARQKSKESRNLLSQLSRLKQNASESQSRMADLERENTRLQASVSELNSRIARVNESMTHILAMLRGRLADLYKFTPAESTIRLILSSGGPHEAVNTAYMLGIFARQDQAMFDELTAKERELVEARAKLEADRSQIAQQTTELKKKREEFDTTIKRTDKLLHDVQSEQKKAEAAARELESAQRAVGSKINSLMNQKKKKASTVRITPSKPGAKAQSVQSQVEGARAAVPVQPSGSQQRRAVTSLSWPVNGQVTMQYGSRIHPTFKTKIFNSGIDIKAAAGTPVKAAGPGEVLYQGWLRGFGQVVIIDHGGDLSTVYAHLSGASVREGAAVKAGTVIGRVGNTGTDAEYGLHFEVRKGGSAVNPMNYLRR